MAFEDQRTTVYKIDPAHPESETLPTLRTEELLLNMGPQHPFSFLTRSGMKTMRIWIQIGRMIRDIQYGL